MISDDFAKAVARYLISSDHPSTGQSYPSDTPTCVLCGDVAEPGADTEYGRVCATCIACYAMA